MKAIVGVWVGARWLAELLEALLFALGAGLVAGGTLLMCVWTIP